MDRKPYSEKEKILLASLVKDYGGILENKKTDGATIAQKLEIWDKIAQFYNCQPDINSTRSAKQLRKLWDNLKQRKRKESTQQRYSQLLTGGGPPQKIKNDPIMSLVEIAAPHADVSLENDFDSTAIYEATQTNETSAAAAETISILVIDSDMEQCDLDGQVDNEMAYQDALKKKVPESIQATGNISQQVDVCLTPNSSIKRKRTHSAAFDEEIKWRVIKAKEALEQQRELHAKRMIAAEAEAEIALIKLRKLKEEYTK